MAKKSKTLKNYLYRVDLDLTGLCNRTCYFCPRTFKSYPNVNEHMSLETIEIVLSELRAFDFHGVIELAGRGEPTLHKEFSKVVDLVTQEPRKWRVRVTTNGYRIDKLWPVYAKIDELILNTYTNQQDSDYMREKYVHLPNGKRIEHYFKPDTLSIEEINNLGPQKDTTKENGGYFNYLFNNRAGVFSEKGETAGCCHPIRQIFIDYHGNYQMCCNDWKYQIKIGNVHERSLIDMYENDPKINRIRWRLLNNQRSTILPCKMCDDQQGASPGTVKWMNQIKNLDIYRHGIIPSAREGAKYDDELRGTEMRPIFIEE
jgi:MoaA/NifB/PqqE/SkfB family radical SAM enzyme